MLAACCSILCLSMVTLVQGIQSVKHLSTPHSNGISSRTRTHPPITVSEYVKSWMRDTATLLWKMKNWLPNLCSQKQLSKRVRKQSTGRNFRPYNRRWNHSQGRWSKKQHHSTRLQCMTAVIAMKARHLQSQQLTRFDTDAKAIRVDNCASYCISNDKKDFVTPLTKVNKKLKGLGGVMKSAVTCASPRD